MNDSVIRRPGIYQTRDRRRARVIGSDPVSSSGYCFDWFGNIGTKVMSWDSNGKCQIFHDSDDDIVRYIGPLKGGEQ